MNYKGAVTDRKVENYIANNLGFEENQLVDCIQDLNTLKERGVNSSLQAVRKKYSHPQYCAIHPYIFQ
jgi:hypothetical protein